MQNRNAIKVFAIVFAIVCLYQLSFTWVADGVQDDAIEYTTTYIEKNKEIYEKIIDDAADQIENFIQKTNSDNQIQ